MREIRNRAVTTRRGWQFTINIITRNNMSEGFDMEHFSKGRIREPETCDWSSMEFNSWEVARWPWGNQFYCSDGERKQTGLAEEKWVLRNTVTIFFSVSVMKLEDLQDRNLELLFQMWKSGGEKSKNAEVRGGWAEPGRSVKDRATAASFKMPGSVPTWERKRDSLGQRREREGTLLNLPDDLENS